MACSIETYRLRIGIHNIKIRSRTSYKQNKTNAHNNIGTKYKQVILIMILLTLTTINPNTIYKTRKQHNKEQHTKNGNHTIKLVQWNMGKANFANKTNELDSIL